jgi:alkaline phosphatase D
MALVPGCRPAPSLRSAPSSPGLTHGLAIGDVTPTGASVWGRCARPGALWVGLQAADATSEQTRSAAVGPDRDWTATVRFDGLAPDSVYTVRAWCAPEDDRTAPVATVQGSVRTAPPRDAPQALRFAWSGDLGGQNVCRDRDEGYAVFDVVAAREPDFFIALGDMIYADDPCRAIGRYGNQQIPGPQEPATTLPAFWSYWKYNRADPTHLRFLAHIPMYAIWDDHEVVNDFGPSDDTPLGGGTRHLLPLGLAAFLDYNPILETPSNPGRLYRSFRWGRHLELFILDTRQYRDLNAAADDGPEPKSMLGAEQRRWLLEQLEHSDATWKLIVTSVPLVIPTGGTRGRDGWAGFDEPTGFRRELRDILREIERRRVRNTLWISTDVHFAAVFRHRPFDDAPGFSFYEIETGPLNAGVFPQDRYDHGLGSERLFMYPTALPPQPTYAQARAWFNFGLATIDNAGNLRIDIVTANNDVVYTLQLDPGMVAGG